MDLSLDYFALQFFKFNVDLNLSLDYFALQFFKFKMLTSILVFALQFSNVKC